MVNISPLPPPLLSEDQAKYRIDKLLCDSCLSIDPLEQFITGTSYETVMSKRVLMAIWIGNVNDMGIESPF